MVGAFCPLAPALRGEGQGEGSSLFHHLNVVDPGWAVPTILSCNPRPPEFASRDPRSDGHPREETIHHGITENTEEINEEEERLQKVGIHVGINASILFNLLIKSYRVIL